MSDIYGYGGDPSYGGGANIGGILSALGSLPMSVIKALYSAPGLPTSNTFNQRFGSLPPAQAAPLPAAINVGNAPQINTADVPQTQQPPIMTQELNAGGPSPSPIATSGQGGGAGPIAGPLPAGGGLFGGLGNLFNGAADAGSPQNPLSGLARGVGGALNGLAGMFAMMGGPQSQQAYYGRMIFNSMYRSLIARGMPPDQALAIASSPQLQQQFYGMPQHVGDVTMGKLGLPVFSTQNGPQLFGTGQGQPGIGALAQQANEIEREQALAEATGTQQGKNATGLPNTSTNLDAAIGTIDNIVKDPATQNILGAKSYIPPIRGTDNYNAYNRLQDLKGQLIPAAVQELQASGAAIRNPTLAGDVAKSISDVDAAQKGSPKAFMESMGRLRAQLVKLKANAYSSAGQQAPAEMETPLAGGTTQSGVKWSIVH